MSMFKQSLFLEICLLMTFTTSFGQTTKPRPNFDSSINVTPAQFEKIVITNIDVLNSKEISVITADEHINIIRAYNTIWMNSRNFDTGIYNELMTILREKEYSQTLTKLYKWTFNRGMGYFFRDLQIEWGGTPHFWSQFTIIGMINKPGQVILIRGE